MVRFYLIIGTSICLLLAYSNTIGWDVMNFNNFDRIGPQGPNIYHK